MVARQTGLKMETGQVDPDLIPVSILRIPEQAVLDTMPWSLSGPSKAP